MEGSETLTKADLDDFLNSQRERDADHRAEVAKLRDQINAGKPQAQSTVTIPSDEELAAARKEEISAHEFYCPGCGKLADYRQQCHGRAEAPHQPIEVVPTAELDGPAEDHTAAPSTENLG